MRCRVLRLPVFLLCILTFWSDALLADDQPVNDVLLLEKRPAKQLSQYRLFKDVKARIPNERVVPYDLNNPLFTDYAKKYRYIYVPKGAAPAVYQEGDALDFPVGSVLVKTFAYPADFAQPKEKIRFVETRLLVHKANGWKAYPYVWNEDQTEALLKVAGKRLEIPVKWITGKSDVVQYAVPNMNQCKGCHVNSEKQFTPIGPKIRNLNKGFWYAPEKKENQISHLHGIGYLDAGKLSPSEMPRIPDLSDSEDGTLFTRARAYLDGNCAHCHSPGRPADTSGLYLDFTEKREIHWGLNKPPVAAGRGSGGFAYDIMPGVPEKSILLFRMKSIDPGIMMPELGRSLIDEDGVKLIEDFIRSLD